MKTSQSELLIAAESLKNMLIGRATGGSPDETVYRNIRGQLIHEPRVQNLLPRFVKTCRSLNEFWGFIKPKFGTYAERREFLCGEFDPLLSFLEQSSQTPSDAVVSHLLEQVDSSHIQTAWNKALERRATDPDGAITIARTLLEEVCKHILDEEHIEYGENPKLPTLYGHVAKHLNISPSQHTVKALQQVLGGCHSVIEGLGSLRSKMGDSHGHGKYGVRPEPRHAELAVNLAGTMAMFLLATWEAGKIEMLHATSQSKW